MEVKIAKKYGNSGCVIVPKQYIGRPIRIIYPEEKYSGSKDAVLTKRQIITLIRTLIADRYADV